MMDFLLILKFTKRESIMKTLMTVLMLIAILYAEQRYGLDDVFKDENSKIWTEKRTNRIASGFVYGVMGNGLSKEFTLKNGKIEGYYKVYSDDGPFHTTYYVNGLEHGKSLWYSWSIPYQISRKENFVNGKQEGKSYSYNDKDASLKRISNYKNGKKHGIQKDFYNSGSLYQLLKYQKGVKISGTSFYKSGEKMGEVKFSTSKKMIGKIFYKNKNIKSKFDIDMKNDSGKVITYYKNKNKEYEIIIENEDEFTGYGYNKNTKYEMNYAQTYNYLKSKEWIKGEK